MQSQDAQQYQRGGDATQFLVDCLAFSQVCSHNGAAQGCRHALVDVDWEQGVVVLRVE
jgi:hypothetical protein